jgi:signal transduction histidine kinase
LAAIGEFASGIAHELRTPLTTVGMALEHLQRLDLPENTKKRIGLARGEAARMRRLLEDILLYAKPLTLNLAPLHLRTLVQRFIDEQDSLAAPRGQRLALSGEPLEATVVGDEDRMRQILANLTQNACEAAPPGSVISWHLTDGPSADTVRLEIRNPGPAIPRDILGHLMEPFFSTKQSGTGLGLAIVKRMVEMQGGEIAIQSEEGEGTRVGLSFPRMGNVLSG